MWPCSRGSSRASHEPGARPPVTVSVLCGGVGAARLLAGLAISPDLDTVVYTVAGAIDPERGWGLRDESWQAMATLERYGGATWFGLGDRDLGTHLYRTQRRQDGGPLSTVTGGGGRGWGGGLPGLPAT